MPIRYERERLVSERNSLLEDRATARVKAKELQRHSEEWGKSAAVIDEKIRDVEAKLRELDKPAEPTGERGAPAVIRFRKRFPGTGSYIYAAIRAGSPPRRWAITQTSHGTRRGPMNWDELLEFIGPDNWDSIAVLREQLNGVVIHQPVTAEEAAAAQAEIERIKARCGDGYLGRF